MARTTTTERTHDRDGMPIVEAPTDREMKSALVGRLRENLYTQDARIRVEVGNRVVVLRGAVPTAMAKRVAGEDAWNVPGVLDVSNQLTVRGR
ncbi:MAG TPA: BON domain-containing protein [Acidimicrobiales bacterium]